MIRLVAISLIVIVVIVHADPTMYKKNEQNLYEPGECWSQKKIEDAKKYGNDVLMSIWSSTHALLNLAYSNLMKTFYGP